MLAYAQFRARNSAAISFFSYWISPVHGDNIFMPPAIIVFPRARYNHYIDYSS